MEKQEFEHRTRMITTLIGDFLYYPDRYDLTPKQLKEAIVDILSETLVRGLGSSYSTDKLLDEVVNKAIDIYHRWREERHVIPEEAHK